VVDYSQQYAKQPSKLPKPTKVRSPGNNVRDVIIAHVISAGAHTYHIHIYRRGNGKVILGPAGRARSARPAGKNVGGAYMRDLTFYLANTPPLPVPRLDVDITLIIIIVMHCRQCLYVFVSNASGMQ